MNGTKPRLVVSPGVEAELYSLLPRAEWDAVLEIVREVPEGGVAFALEGEGTQWALFARHEPKWKPLKVDFNGGSLVERVTKTANSSEPLRRLIHGAASVWDGTLGLGEDSFLMAIWGAKVTSFERHPLLYFLVDRALAAFRKVDSRPLDWTLRFGHAAQSFAGELVRSGPPDIVYLDPMYPERKKTALGSKELRMIKDLVGEGNAGEDEELVRAALEVAQKKVLLKRPLHAETLDLDGRNPQTTKGRTTRWDIYPARATAARF